MFLISCDVQQVDANGVATIHILEWNGRPKRMDVPTRALVWTYPDGKVYVRGSLPRSRGWLVVPPHKGAKTFRIDITGAVFQLVNIAAGSYSSD